MSTDKEILERIAQLKEKIKLINESQQDSPKTDLSLSQPQPKERNMDDLNLNLKFKIGMIAPSGAGKTTLLNAIYYETRERLIGEGINIYHYDTEELHTTDAIKEAIANFKTCIAADNFATPDVGGDVDSTDYLFEITIGTGPDMRTAIIAFKDYPGGYVDSHDFDREMADFIHQCSVILVPIASDYLMTWKTNQGKQDSFSMERTKLADKALNGVNVLPRIKEWIAARKEYDSKSFLIFVPVKCEAYFNDNEGLRDEHKTLMDAVKEYYHLEELAGNPEIRVEISAVDTYGIVEHQNMKIVEENSKRRLQSIFRRRTKMGSDIKPLGAFNILVSALYSQLSTYSNDLSAQKDEVADDLQDITIRRNALKEKIRNRKWYQKFIAAFYDPESPQIPFLENEIDKDKVALKLLSDKNEEVLEKIKKLKGLKLNLPDRYCLIPYKE